MYNSQQKNSHTAQIFIKIINKFRDIGLQQYINIPKITVCGDQSSGKSSLLQSIVGFDFLPRGTGIVTRTPLQLRLIQHEKQQAFGFFYEQQSKYTNFELIRQRIEQQTIKIAGNNKGIIDIPIKLTICAKYIPNLTLIDLPGITRISLANSDQEKIDIETLTTNLVAKYCKNDPTSIILCVIPANIDITTSHALQLARIWDPKGQRTLGVITKIDLMDHGTNAASVLNNIDVPLKFGFIAIKNRSQEDINNKMSAKMCQKQQIEYFKNHYIYNKMPKQLFGIKSLCQRMSKILYNLIKEQIPFIQKQIKQKLNQNLQNLKSLGTQLPTTLIQKFSFLWKLIQLMFTEFNHEIKGKLKEVDAIEKNYSGGILIKVMFRQLYHQYAQKDYKILSQISDQMIDRTIKMHQGESIPGFPSIYSFMSLITPHLIKLRQPAIKCLNDVYTYIRIILGEVIQKVFINFSEMGDEIIDIVEQLIVHKKNKVEQIIEINIESQINFLFTNDLLYEQKRTKLIPDETEIMKSKNENNSQEKLKSRKQKIFINEMRLRVQEYYKIVINVLRDLIPKNIGYHFLRNCQQNLQFQLYKILLSRPNLIQNIGQQEQTINQRKKLKKNIEVLKKSLEVLHKQLHSKSISLEDI